MNAEDEAVGTAIEKLGRFAHNIRYEDLPDSAIAAVKRLLIDAIGCALGAVDCGPAAVADRAFQGTIYRQGDVSVIGRTATYSLEGAALLNGMQTRYLDFNDVYWSKDVCHPSENIPLALSCADERQVSGRKLIEAVVVGYEVQTRLCDAFSFGASGFHHVSAAGYAGPLVAGKVFGLDSEQLSHAAAISGAQHHMLGAISRGQISMIKALGYPAAALAGIMSARLAKEGFTGPLRTLEWLFERFGTDEPNVGAAQDLDLTTDRYLVEDVSLKLFPIQYSLQTPVEAVLEIRPEITKRLPYLSKVVVATYEHVAMRTADPAKYRPENRETADHSLPVCVALALVDGQLNHHQFDRGRWRDPDVMRVVDITEVEVNGEFERKLPAGRATTVTLHFSDGPAVSKTLEVPTGDAENPFSADVLERKFLSLATPVLGESQSRRVLDALWDIENLVDVRTLCAMLRPNRTNSPD